MVIEDLALLFVRGLGSRGIAHLIEMYGSAEAIYNTPLDRLVNEAGLRPEIAERIAQHDGMREAEAEIKYCRRQKICAIAATDAEYPIPLRETSDRPHVLFVMGNVEALHKQTLSVVGTRKASSLGPHFTDMLIGQLAKQINNLCIVSGLAYGIDCASHRSALSHGATTVAVVADVLPNVSPASHRNLANAILDNGGALASELHSQTKQNGQLYISRNRIIAGLSMGTLIVESPASGGSIATADIVDSYNRTLMAVPGRINDPQSFGTNNLIRTGKARLVMTANDIIEELGWRGKDTEAIPDIAGSQYDFTPEEQLVYNTICNAEQLSWTEIVHQTNLSLGELSMIITNLEIKGAIKSLPGKRYERI